MLPRLRGSEKREARSEKREMGGEMVDGRELHDKGVKLTCGIE
jgi:hypothetical protein